jgi:hypothetical protein
MAHPDITGETVTIMIRLGNTNEDQVLRTVAEKILNEFLAAKPELHIPYFTRVCRVLSQRGNAVVRMPARIRTQQV